MDNLNTNEIFEEQRQQILSIRKEINLLAQQVDYLIRNEKPLGLLDVDVLMNRTHTLYDMLCSIEFEPQNDNSEEDFDEDMVNVLANAVAATTNNAEETNEEEPTEAPNTTESSTFENTPNENHVEEEQTTEPETTEPEQTIDYDNTTEEPKQQAETIIEPEEKAEKQDEEPTGYINFDAQEIDNPYTLQEDSVNENTIPETDMVDGVETFVMHFDDVPIEQTQQAEDKIDEGFIYGMEQDEISDEQEEGQPVEKVVSDPIFEIITPQGDSAYNEEEDEDEENNDNTESGIVEPEENIEVAEDTNDSIIETSEDVKNNLDETEETNNDPEILGEKMITEDNSLAAKLQNRPVGDLKSAIGINDKFLFVNELFGGSMDKYNRSIENLNDIQTYNGALIYLNELKVELQWNSNNVAYKKLSELVKLKFD